MKKTVKLSDANLAELRHRAMVLGLDFTQNHNAATLRSKILAASGGEADQAFEVDVEEPKPAVQAAPAAVGTEGAPADAAPKSSDWVWVTVHRSEEVGGNDPVPVSHNGVAMHIPRGKPVRIRRWHLEILQHAVRDVWDTDEDGNISGKARQVPAYPYSYHGVNNPEPAAA